MKIMKKSIKKADYFQLKSKKHLIVIAVNEEVRIREFLTCLEEAGFKGKITFYAQPKMCSALKEVLPQAGVIEWEGVYTKKMAEDIIGRKEFNDADAFLFFCKQFLDLRDQNIMEIAELLQKKRTICVYGLDTDNELCEYENVDIYNKAVHSYLEINDLLGIYYARRYTE